MGDVDRALRVCETSLDAMLRGGQAPTLWRLIGAREGPAWRSYRLHVATQLSDVKVTTLLDEPPSDALVDRLLWVRALSVEARAADAVVAADAALSEVAARCGDERIAYWAALERAMASRVQAGPQRGLELLEHARPIDDATRALGAALAAFWLAEAGRIEESIRTLERSALERGSPLETPLAEPILGGPVDFFVRYYRMAAFMEVRSPPSARTRRLTTGRASTSTRTISSVRPTSSSTGSRTSRSRAADWTKPRPILERLLRATPPTGGNVPSPHRPAARHRAPHRRRERLVTSRQTSPRLRDDTRKRDPLVFAWCADTGERIDLASAVREGAPLDFDSTPLGAAARSVFGLRRVLRRAHWGKRSEVPEAIDVEGSIVRELVFSTLALVAGDDAVAPARRSVELAVSHGWGVRECEARALLVEALIVGGEPGRALGETRAPGQARGRDGIAPFRGGSSPPGRARGRSPASTSPRWRRSPSWTKSRRAPRDGRAPSWETQRASTPSTSAWSPRRTNALGSRSSGCVRPGCTREGGGARRAALGGVVSRRSPALDDVRYALLARVLETLAHHGGVASFEELARRTYGKEGDRFTRSMTAIASA